MSISRKPSYIKTFEVAEQVEIFHYIDENIPDFWSMHAPTIKGDIEALSPAFNSATWALAYNMDFAPARLRLGEAIKKGKITKERADKLDEISKMVCSNQNDTALCRKGIYLNIGDFYDYIIQNKNNDADKVIDRYHFSAEIFEIYVYALFNKQVTGEELFKQAHKAVCTIKAEPLTVHFVSPKIPKMPMEKGDFITIPTAFRIHTYQNGTTRKTPINPDNPADNGFGQGLLNEYQKAMDKSIAESPQYTDYLTFSH